MFDGSHVNLLVAFVGGLVAFFAPCVFPLLPAYLGYFGGVAIHRDAAELRTVRWRLFRHSLFFVLGFVMVFVIMGLGASSLSGFFIRHREIISRLAGILFIFFGLYLLGVFKSPWLYREAKFDAHKFFTHSEPLNAFLIGLTFAFAWTPCIGPVLASILFLASQSESMQSGALLLFVFALGIATPFLLVSLLLGHLASWLKRFQKVSYYVQRVAGALLLLIGLLMLLNQLGLLSSWLLDVFSYSPAL